MDGVSDVALIDNPRLMVYIINWFMVKSENIPSFRTG